MGSTASRLVLLFTSFALLPALGCASSANPSAMVPAATDVQNRHPGSVSVNVRGGHETNPLWTSQVSNADFKKALEDAILKSQLFESVKPQGDAQYHVEIVMQRLDQPIVGFNMKVVAVVNWELVRKGEPKPFWQDAVVSQHTASVGDHFVGIERLRLANEGAIRMNIKEGIEKLSRLKL